MKKIKFIADFFIEEVFGGGEIVNEEIIKNLKENGYEVEKIRCRDVYKDNLDGELIIGNFISLNSFSFSNPYSYFIIVTVIARTKINYFTMVIIIINRG